MKINDPRIPWPEIGAPVKLWEVPEDLELDTNENVEVSSKDFKCTVPKGTIIPLKVYPNCGMILYDGYMYTY